MFGGGGGDGWLWFSLSFFFIFFPFLFSSFWFALKAHTNANWHTLCEIDTPFTQHLSWLSFARFNSNRWKAKIIALGWFDLVCECVNVCLRFLFSLARSLVHSFGIPIKPQKSSNHKTQLQIQIKFNYSMLHCCDMA